MFSLHRSEGKPVLVADIAEGGVGLAFISMRENAPAHVLFSSFTPLATENRTPEHASATIQTVLETALESIQKNTMAQKYIPREIYCVVHPPWTHFRTATAEEMGDVQTITRARIGSLAHKALSANPAPNHSSPFEAGVIQIFLNGYPTANPIGKKAESVSVVAFESEMNGDVRSALQGLFGKFFPGRSTVFYSGMRTKITLMHDVLPNARRLLLIDIGTSTAACAVIRKESITQFAETPHGTTEILGRIGDSNLEETRTLLRILSSDRCSTSTCQTLKDSIARAEPDLVRAFGEMLGAIATVRRIPNTTLLIAPDEFLPWLTGFFSRIDFSQFTETTQPLDIHCVSPERLLNLVTSDTVEKNSNLVQAVAAVNILAHTSV